jgi:hypothetical protein
MVIAVSTHLNEQRGPSQRTSRNQCLLRYGQVLKKFAYLDEWKKILEPVSKKVQLLEISVFPLSGEFSVNNHIQQLQALTLRDHHFPNSSSQNVLKTDSL